MVSIRLVVGGMKVALDAVALLGAAGKAVNGPLASWSSTAAYARVIETGMRGGRMWRRAGPALMFQKGVAEAAAQAPALLLAAIPKGAASVGQAKAKIRTLGLERIRALTPVRTGNLRDSVRVVERPA